MALWSLLLVQYILADFFLSLFAIGLYSPTWNFQASQIADRLSADYSFFSSPLDFVAISIIRITILLLTCLIRIFKKEEVLQKFPKAILVFSVLSYSYSLSKLLGFSSNEEYLSYPGVWISIGWTIISSGLFYMAWNHIVEEVKTTNYEHLTDEGENVNRIAEPAKEEDEMSRTEVIWMLLKFCQVQWVWFGIGLFFVGLYSFTRVFIPLVTGQVIDAIVKGRSTDYLFHYVLILGGLTLGNAVFGGIRSFFLEIATSRLLRYIRHLLFESIVHQEIAFFDMNKTGEIVSRLTSDCERISISIAWNLNFFIRHVVMFIGSLLFMFTLSWELAVVNFIFIPPVSLMLKEFGAYFDGVAAIVQTTVSKANQVAQEVFSTMKTVRSFACEERELAKFDMQLDLTLAAFRKKAYAFAAVVFTNELWQNAVLTVVLFYGGHLVHEGKMTSDQLITFMLYQIQISSTIERLFYEFTGLMEAVGASRKVFAYINREPSIKNDGVLKPVVQGHIELKNVHFSYASRPNHEVIKGLDLTIDAGCTLALVGPSGGGKSSIVSLIEHFYEPSEGSITLDGTPVHNLSHEHYHERVALVAQEPVLYCGTVRENILYGCDWATEEDMLSAAEKANVHEFVSQMENGYDTECGEKGVQMSGGQKQRIAIARALVRRPSVLILDEATSALDAESEALVQEAINKCATERTVLIIAHRLSTIERADKIAFIQQGSVVQIGTHAELMVDKEGPYHRLVSKQVAVGSALI